VDHFTPSVKFISESSNPRSRRSGADKPLLKSWEQTKADGWGFPRKTDSMVPCVKEARAAIIAGEKKIGAN